MRFELCAPCHFGLEAVLKREIYDLGYEISRVEDGRVSFWGDEEALVLANLHLRTAERVLLVVGRFQAVSFEALFEGIRSLPWEAYIPKDGRFWVKKAVSVKSTLHSIPDIQSVSKKAMVERLGQVYRVSYFSETGSDYPVRLFLMKDEATVTLDTSGISLHKRGYRSLTSQAPISETLASALLKLTPWKPNRILADPFCGSGTFLIEAAMMASNRAPGLSRSFTSESWTNLISPRTWTEAREEARKQVLAKPEVSLQGYDIDAKAVSLARENARRAGVGGLIHFQQRPIAAFSHPKKYGFIVTNPPYGERLSDEKTLSGLYGQLGSVFRELDSWSLFVITSYDGCEKAIGRRADKNRKIYNGMIQTRFYSFLGPKPPKRDA